jgi:23S rRNA pseudouridine1911/1915/1917 synthase
VGSDQVPYCDRHIVVVRKPAGISSVSHEDEPTSLQEQMQSWLTARERRPCPPLKVVHRLDKVTSGVMLFARNAQAQSNLKDQFRAHSTGRYYVAVAQGSVQNATLHFRLVRNRGDGLRGVTQDPGQGRHSVTHVSVLEQLARCTVLRCQLETGRTHQIRIHLATIGHPVIGDPVYGKDYSGLRLEAPRTLLHASFLSFSHPVTRQRLSFEDPLPADFEAWLREERRG